MDKSKLVLTLNAGESRLYKEQGYSCISASSLRKSIGLHLQNETLSSLLIVLSKLAYVSDAVDFDNWAMWEKYHQNSNHAKTVIEALRAVPSLPTLLRDPENLLEVPSGAFWSCTGTTLLVARDTLELVRVADSYATSNCYRRKGRMDEAFKPIPNKTCLLTIDELGLIRLDEGDKIDVVFCYEFSKPQVVSGLVATPVYPSALRVLCGSYQNIRVGIATTLVAPRMGSPFFIGLTRGVGYETTVKTNTLTDAARAYCFETNCNPSKLKMKMVLWRGEDNVRELVKVGGLSIYTGYNSRRKVQLLSLGLIRAGMLAGVYIYNLSDNYPILRAWSVDQRFIKPSTTQKALNNRRGGPTPSHQNSVARIHEGVIYNTIPYPPHVFERHRKTAYKIKQLPVYQAGVATVRLTSLRESNSYYLNARAKDLPNGDIELIQQRCTIRCPQWSTGDPDEMIKWLSTSTNVIVAGITDANRVFAVVRVANGTEDQQRSAVSAFGEHVGRLYPHASGCASYLKESIDISQSIFVKKIEYVEYRVESLITHIYAPYDNEKEYTKHLKMKREGTHTPLERANRYIERVKGLQEQGERNTTLASTMLNIINIFGVEVLTAITPDLFAMSTLPESDKISMYNRLIHNQRSKEKDE